MKRLVWFRRDLRVHDNPALWYACQGDHDVLAVSFICQAQWQQHGMGQRLNQLTINALGQLNEQLSRLNIPLLLLDASTFSNSETLLKNLVTQLKIDQVFFNYEYELNEIQRDSNINDWSKTQTGLELFCFHDQCIIPPGNVLNKQQQMFKVYSPFKKAWCQTFSQFSTAPLNKPALQAHNRFRFPIFRESQPGSGPQQNDLAQSLVTLNEVADPLWPVNEELAHEQLATFLQQQVSDYHNNRDFPAKAATSRLSCYLSLGLLSTRQCLHSAWQANACLLVDGEPGLNSWINELIWREFYRHLLVAFPHLNKHQAFKSDTENVPWRYNQQDFAAWCQGKTGYPIVDAAQRQLLETGWMHNRLRMVSAMFLSKHLLIDWRWGEAWFAQHLVDFDLASNNGGWQWSASTGADGAPYFRIFNPTTQSQKFDPAAEFIARFVPELASLPAKSRHQPNTAERQRCHYPDEIVAHKFARERALEAFRNPPPAASNPVSKTITSHQPVDRSQADLFTLTEAGTASNETTR